MKSRWIAVTAAGALGISAIAAGAMGVASAIEIRDAQGAPITTSEVHEIRGETAPGGSLDGKITDGPGVVPSPTEAPTAQSPTQVDMVSANTVGSAYSIVSVASAGSPD